MKLKKPSKNALIIFTKNPVLGKCKTRLAKTIGDEKALNIYCFLLQHTVNVTSFVEEVKYVFYSESIQEDDVWDHSFYRKKIQRGANLGERMENAFTELFEFGHKNIVIIGSDIFDLTLQDLEIAFATLVNHDFVIGPAQDGGYYLLGMKEMYATVFKNKKWGSDSVLKDTLKDLQGKTIFKLPLRNDVDVVEDIKNIEIFQKFL